MPRVRDPIRFLETECARKREQQRRLRREIGQLERALASLRSDEMTDKATRPRTRRRESGSDIPPPARQAVGAPSSRLGDARLDKCRQPGTSNRRLEAGSVWLALSGSPSR
jgi:hypothetical protein